MSKASWVQPVSDPALLHDSPTQHHIDPERPTDPGHDEPGATKTVWPSRIWIWASLVLLLASIGLLYFALDRAPSTDKEIVATLLALVIVGLFVSLIVSLFNHARGPDSPRARRWSRRWAWGLTFLMASMWIAIAGSIAYQAATGPSQASIEADQRHADLVSALDRAVSEVTIPAEWDVEFQGSSSYSPSVGYMASSDLASSGTWMLVLVARRDGEFSRDRFWDSLEQIERERDGAVISEPLPTSLSGVPGYLFEVSGLTGAKTGQELGAYVATFFGPQYTYQVMVQFEMRDRDDMNLLYRNTLIHLTVSQNPIET